ncbi:hypothetical protein DMENIID0001_087460 [Sergentomyia squamirostris]
MDPLRSLVASLRALIISRPQNTTLQDLIREYREMEGAQIPFMEFGYSKLEDFLLSTNLFEIRKLNEQTIVRAVSKRETEHLVKMIAAQKKPKKKSGGAGAGYRSTGGVRQSHSYRPPSQPRFLAGTGSTYRPLRLPPPAPRLTSKTSRSGDYRPRHRVEPPVADQLRPVRPKPSSIIQKPSVNYRIRSENKEDGGKRIVVAPESKNHRLTQQSSVASSPSLTPTPSPPIQPNTQKYSNGFKFPAPASSTPLVIPPGYVEPKVSILVAEEPEVFTLSHQTRTPIEDLEKYCKNMHYSNVNYSYSCVRFKGGETMFQCRVTILNKTYCTYPQHCKSFEEAQTAGARLAIQKILKEEEIKQYPICREDDVTIAEKLLEILDDFDTGLIDTAIPDQFRTKFGLSLPENWLSLLYKYNWFSVEEISNKRIVYVKFITRPDLLQEMDVTVFEPLQLPWAEKEWTIQITNAIATTEIYGRIIGDQYSKRLHSLLDDIEMAMMTTKMSPEAHEDIQEGQIYLVTNDTNWSRVKVEVIDQENQSYHCFCIDSGEQEVYTKLYKCSQEYLKLPNQAIRFSLSCLKDFKGNPYVKPHLDAILAHSHFVAKVLTKRDEFEENNGEEPIEVVLMNPDSPQLEGNINQIILEKVCNETPAPQLERSAISYVKITHVSDEGDVFCQMKDIEIGLNYIQRLIDNVVIDEAKFPLRKSIEREDPSIRYLIRDSNSGRWYRAIPATPVSLKKSNHQMYCIDFGFILDVSRDDICQLEPLSQALCNFPALAIKCRLYGLPELSGPIVSRIKGLLSEDSECFMKAMVSTSQVFQVNCYMRHEGGFFCINESIKIGEELERQNDSKTPRSSPNSPSVDEDFPRFRATTPNPNVTRSMSMKDIEDYELPAIESPFTFCIVLSSSPSNFISQPFDDKINVLFQKMTKKLQAFCSGNNDRVEQVHAGQAYAVFDDKSVQWHRAIVNVVISPQQIQVTLCDVGEMLIVGMNKILTLPNEFRELPKQAIRCSLYGIKPANIDWTTDDILRFRELTSIAEKKFYSIVKNIQVNPDGGKILELTLIDKSSTRDAIINDLLLKENRAVHA